MKEENHNQDPGHDGNYVRLTENNRYRAECDLDGYDRWRDERIIEDRYEQMQKELEQMS